MTRADADGARASRHGLRPISVRQDGIATNMHVIAVTAQSAFVYGASTLRAGAAVVLTVGSDELAARVGWCDGRRARLDTTAAPDTFAVLMGIGPDPELAAAA
jgi:DNA-binding LytR/AlgR family response regulator